MATKITTTTAKSKKELAKPVAVKKVKAAKAGDSAAGAHKPVDALMHKFDEDDQKSPRRIFIPSREEAGNEAQALEGKPTVKNIALNPVTTRGQDPELYWLEKYGTDDQQKMLDVDIRSLYRHEHIAPEKIIEKLYRFKERQTGQDQLFANELFGNPLSLDEMDKPLSYYKQFGDWQNRLIQGDSLLTMTSLLEREGMAGQVQCVYMDPPYGIKYGSNWQMKLGDRNVKDGADENLSGEPEVIKAFRDTWELGIHSYLSYLRDRLLVAKELLSTSGSCFVQISDENVHLVRCLMDEVFGSENFVSEIAYATSTGRTSGLIDSPFDRIIWFAKDKSCIKFKRLFREEAPTEKDYPLTGVDGERYTLGDASSQHPSLTRSGPLEFQGQQFYPPKGRQWSFDPKEGFDRLVAANRFEKFSENQIRIRKYFKDFPVSKLTAVWTDTQMGAFSSEKMYVVQTGIKVIQRCILMTTDPGDLVLDPTCGSGTTAFVSEQWGRRWITSDTSRIALNIAKTRLMTATFPWYKLLDAANQDVRHGFIYKTVPHVTLKSLANNEPPETETLYDQPEQDKKKLRVAGPFTVETLQSFEPIAPEDMAAVDTDSGSVSRFMDLVFEHLKTAGIKNGIKGETAVFTRLDVINEKTGVLHAEGWYTTADGEKKAYLHIGPQFGAVSKQAVNDAMRAFGSRGDADWLVVLGFAFESDVQGGERTQRRGNYEVTKVRMHDDLMQDGLIKKDKKAASFVTIGEPDIGLARDGDQVQVEIRGLDIYDPVRDEVKARSVADIAYWMLDDQYDGSNFMPTQVFFCGGERSEFDKFKRGLHSLALSSTKKAAERTLKIEMDDEAFERVYGFISHPVPLVKGRKLAVRVVSQFGEESTKVLTL